MSISGFAKFAKVERAARMGRNPATGEPIRIKASKKVRVTPMKAFKDAVMSPGLAPRLARGVWPLEATTASKAPARKTTAKKTAAKKTAARKTTAAKRTTAAKKAPVRRTTAKKAVARKPAAKKTAARRR